MGLNESGASNDLICKYRAAPRNKTNEVTALEAWVKWAKASCLESSSAKPLTYVVTNVTINEV